MEGKKRGFSKPMVICYIIHHQILCGKYLNLWCILSFFPSFLSFFLSARVSKQGGGAEGKEERES